MIRGVNVGNWLVLEKWMSPKLFEGTDAEDEFYLCADLDEAEPRPGTRIGAGSHGVPVRLLHGGVPQDPRTLRWCHRGVPRRLPGPELADFFSTASFERFVVDIHLYLMEYLWRTGDDDLDAYVRHATESFAGTVRDMSALFPLIIGEWCIDTTSTTPSRLQPAERAQYYRRLAAAQLAAWEGAEGLVLLELQAARRRLQSRRLGHGEVSRPRLSPRGPVIRPWPLVNHGVRASSGVPAHRPGCG
jgi:hypothetical protein